LKAPRQWTEARLESLKIKGVRGRENRGKIKNNAVVGFEDSKQQNRRRYVTVVVGGLPFGMHEIAKAHTSSNS